MAHEDNGEMKAAYLDYRQASQLALGIVVLAIVTGWVLGRFKSA